MNNYYRIEKILYNEIENIEVEENIDKCELSGENMMIGEKIFETEINNIIIKVFDVTQNPFYEGVKVSIFLYAPDGTFDDFVDNELITIFSDNVIEVCIPEDDTSDYYTYPYELCVDLLDILGLY